MRVHAGLRPSDRAPLLALLSDTPEFNASEIETALELIDDALNNPDSTYRILRAYDDEESLLGYLCFGQTPMTRSTIDLYWLATARSARGQGVGRALINALFDSLDRRRAWTIRVETGTREMYAPTIAFYERLAFREAGRIPNFYDEGDDLLTLIFVVEREDA